MLGILELCLCLRMLGIKVIMILLGMRWMMMLMGMERRLRMMVVVYMVGDWFLLVMWKVVLLIMIMRI